MIITLFSWLIILAYSMILGRAFVTLIWGEKLRDHRITVWDTWFVSGFMILTVYAQLFSLFYKVGKVAFVCLSGIVICLGLLWLVDRKKRKPVWKLLEVPVWKVCLTILLVGIVCLYTMRAPEFVDTYLYHIQAMKWIEEYGVVPGLGNLHFRFAYNSAFLALQALFSFSWVGEPLHSVNGCIAAFFVVYGLVTNHFFSDKEKKVSDALKLVIFPYVFFNRTTLASPGTDVFAMLLVLYIMIKWSEGIESGQEQDKLIDVYALFSILAVFAVTVKLSTASLVMLALFPGVMLLRDKAWKRIGLYVLLGLVVLCPWMVRSVLISGYLVYPYTSLDLFSVDWKMPISLAEYDKMEIVVWGRGVRDVQAYSDPIWVWFPTWIQSQSLRDKALIAGGFMATLILLVITLKMVVDWIRNRKNTSVAGAREINRILLYGSMIVCELFWLFSSPLVRYGMVFLMLPMAVILFYLERRFGERWNRVAFIVGTVLGTLFVISGNDQFRLMQPHGYWKLDMEQHELQNVVVYCEPDDHRLSDYEMFPAISEISVLDTIELRGKGLQSGFRPKAND